MIQTAPSTPPPTQQETSFLYRAQQFVFAPFQFQFQTSSTSPTPATATTTASCHDDDNDNDHVVVPPQSPTLIVDANCNYGMEESTDIDEMIVENSASSCSSTTTSDMEDDNQREGTTESSSLFDEQVNSNNNNNNKKRDKNNLCVFTSAAYKPKVGYNKEKAAAQELRGRRDCGEDAFFILDKFSTQPEYNGEDNERVCAIGIADGVGGYSNMGVDPSIMAWALMEESRNALDNNGNITPYDALIEAYENIRRNNLVECGGSTACVLLLSKGKDRNGKHVLKLQSSNLGDSAFMIIRDGKVVYRSMEQTHFWNCPLQMCVPPKNVADVFQDHPREADVLPEPFELRPGDVVIAATDGLTDNVFDEEIAEIVAKHISKPEIDDQAKSDMISNDILQWALRAATSRIVYTPFQKYAEMNRYVFRGGKNDDICLVVALVQDPNSCISQQQ